MSRMHLLHTSACPDLRETLLRQAARQGVGLRPLVSDAGAASWETDADLPDREELLRALLGPVRRTGAIFVMTGRSGPLRAVLFDLDATLIACEFIDELAERMGAAHRTCRLTADAMEGRIDFAESYRRRIALLRGTPLSAVDAVIAGIPLAEGAAETVAALRRSGCRTAIVTGGYDRPARAVRERLGIDAVYAAPLEERDGCLTGRIAGPLPDSEGKVAALRDFCGRNGCALSEAGAVGDGANDLKMLAAAGTAVLYHALPEAPAAALPLDRILPLIGIGRPVR